MYKPTPVPAVHDAELQMVVRWLSDELRAIENAINTPEFEGAKFSILNVAPAKPENGDVAYADGTNWNPGGTGAGLYQYVGGAWSKL